MLDSKYSLTRASSCPLWYSHCEPNVFRDVSGSAAREYSGAVRISKTDAPSEVSWTSSYRYSCGWK